jgi:DNA-binding response OmpR family regulator
MTARLLLVEDEPDIRLIARAAVARAGFAVLTARDGAEALSVAARVQPDLIVLDWMLPDMSGGEVCARLKDDPATARIPIVFLTARSDNGARAECLAVGAAGCIAKPFDPLALGGQLAAIWREAAQLPPAGPPRAPER